MVMTAITRAARRSTAVAAVTCGAAALAALLTACGSGSSPASGSSGTASGTTATPQGSHGPDAASASTPASSGTTVTKTQCATSGLSATVDASQGGAAAGSDYVPINFTNISSHTCVMYGFPGVSWVTAIKGSQIGAAATRETSYGPVTITLAPGASAHAIMQIADAGNFPSSACQPVTANWVRIYPPDQFTPLYAKYSTQVCAKKISGGSFPLGILPIRSGRAVRGQTP
jgi:hypothetical protein